jgi:hypothetical protein
MGETVVALSRTEAWPELTASVGIVIATSRRLGNGETVLQVDSSVSTPARSGLLIDTKGRLLGVLLPSETVALATPGNRIREIALKP